MQIMEHVRARGTDAVSTVDDTNYLLIGHRPRNFKLAHPAITSSTLMDSVNYINVVISLGQQLVVLVIN